MIKIASIALMLIGTAGFAMASLGVAGAPEIDPASAVGAVALLSGSLLVLRARRRK